MARVPVAFDGEKTMTMYENLDFISKIMLADNRPVSSCMSTVNSLTGIGLVLCFNHSRGLAEPPMSRYYHFAQIIAFSNGQSTLKTVSRNVYSVEDCVKGSRPRE